jgi:hypothetical protein
LLLDTNIHSMSSSLAKEPIFSSIAFLRRSYGIASGFHFLGFDISDVFSHSKVINFASNSQSGLYLCPQ